MDAGGALVGIFIMNKDQIDRQQLKLDLLNRLRLEHPTVCRRWFEDVQVIGVVDGSIVIQIQEPVQLKYLQRCCTQPFTDAAQSVTGHLLGVRFVGDEENSSSLQSIVISGDVSGGGSVLSSSGLEEDMLISPDYSFDNFVVGPGKPISTRSSNRCFK